MIRILQTTTLLSSLALGACAGTPATTPPPMSDPSPPVAMQCNAEPARVLIGQPATPANVDAARTKAGAKTWRVLKPGMMVTMEYRDDRLNIDVDANNLITNVRCG